MADIFRDIGQAVTSPFGNLFQGAYEGLAPGAFQQARLEKLRKEFELAPTPEAKQKLLMSYFRKNGPEIMKNMPQGAYLPQEEAATGKPPWWTDPAMREEFPEETGIAGGTKPRATDPWIQLGRMTDTEANLGVDVDTGKARFPALTKEINRRINEYQLPGMKREQSPSERRSMLWPFGEGPDKQIAPKKPPTKDTPAAAEYGKDLFNMYGKVLEPSSKALPKAPRDATDFAIWKEVRGKWYKLPVGLREEIRAALSATNPQTGKKYTWSEIIADETVSAELAKIK